MKVGDLVVRMWNDKPKWDMVGIIVSKDFDTTISGAAKWIYGIKWNKRDLILPGEFDPFGNWTEKEFEVINGYR